MHIHVLLHGIPGVMVLSESDAYLVASVPCPPLDTLTLGASFIVGDSLSREPRILIPRSWSGPGRLTLGG